MPLFANASISIPSVRANTIVPSNITLGTAAQVLLTANTTTRLGASIYNASSSNLYIDWNPSVATDDCTVKIPPGGYYETAYNPDQSLYGILDSGSGTICVREFTE